MAGPADQLARRNQARRQDSGRQPTITPAADRWRMAKAGLKHPPTASARIPWLSLVPSCRNASCQTAWHRTSRHRTSRHRHRPASSRPASRDRPKANRRRQPSPSPPARHDQPVTTGRQEEISAQSTSDTAGATIGNHWQSSDCLRFWFLRLCSGPQKQKCSGLILLRFLPIRQLEAQSIKCHVCLPSLDSRRRW